MSSLAKLSEYRDWLRDLKQHIRTGQIKAALSVNSRLIMLYWELGGQICEKQEKSRWGSGFIGQLSRYLMSEFPEMSGFSERNLHLVKQWRLFYSQSAPAKVKQLVSLLPRGNKTLATPRDFGNAQPAEGHDDLIATQLVPILSLIPWGHHVKIIQRVKDAGQAMFYIGKTIENNWSRAVLDYHIETDLCGRQGKAVTNFEMVLPKPQSDLANEMMKDPYNFAFLRLSENVVEADLEKALVGHISRFLLELGMGFAYMGRQFPLKVGRKNYQIDLLFYHTRLKCYIVIELKTKEFEPEFVGKLNFYTTAVNELVKDGGDKATIGILLCRNKDNYEVEFSLKDVNNPIGVSSFLYTELADDMKKALPSAETLKNELLNFEREHAK